MIRLLNGSAFKFSLSFNNKIFNQLSSILVYRFIYQQLTFDVQPYHTSSDNYGITMYIDLYFELFYAVNY